MDIRWTGGSGMRRMYLGAIAGFMVLATKPAVSHATLIAVGYENNVAPLATPSVTPSHYFAFSETRAIDGLLEINPGYAEQSTLIFSIEASGYQLTLTFPTVQHLGALGAFVGSSHTPGIADDGMDRPTGTVSYDIDQGRGFINVGMLHDYEFIVAPQDPTKIWALAEIQGDYANVSKVRFTFTSPSASRWPLWPVRVGEVIALTAPVPEPATLSMLVIGAMGLMTMARRRGR